MIPIVKEIIVYSRYDFFNSVFPFGLLIQMVMAMMDNENYNCFEVALFQVACSTNVVKQGSKKFLNPGVTLEHCRCQKCDKKPVPYRGPKNIRHHNTKFSCTGHVSGKICALLLGSKFCFHFPCLYPSR